MRIAHVFPVPAWGGAEIQMMEIALWQREQGIDAVVWCLEGTPIHKESVKRGIPVILDPLPFRALLPPVFKILKTVDREKLTHVHVHWSTGLRLFWPLKLFRPKVKLIYYIHMWITRTKKDPFHYMAYRQFDKLTVSGQRAKQAVMRHLPFRENQIEICPYGVDFRALNRPLREGAHPAKGLRAKYGLPEDKLIFGFFGRIDRQKGVKEFAVAAHRVLQENPNVHLLMVGSPTLGEVDAVAYAKEVEDILDASPFKDRIHRFPHQSDFQPLLACVDLLVLPSYMECYSILIVHSFGLGIPVVSTDAGGTPDLIEAPRRGWLVPPRETQDLEKTLLWLAKNPEEIFSKSEACRTYAHSHHSHSYVVQRFTEIYR